MPQSNPGSPCSILIADNTAERRSALAAIFRGENYRLVLAVNGKDALDKAVGQHFDLVITGIVMSALDGIELVGALRKQKPRLPVIVVAEGRSSIEATYLRYASLMGAARTFSHPLDPPAFLNEVQALLSQGCWSARQEV